MSSWPSRVVLTFAVLAVVPLVPGRRFGLTRDTAPSPAGTQGDTSMAAVQRALRAAVAAQEQYYNAHKTYAASASALARLLPPTPRVSIQIMHADDRGWTGAGRSQAAPGRSCVIYIGLANAIPELPATDRERRRPTREAIPVCDGV